MNIQITGRHINITEPLRDYIEKKFKKFERHFDHITQTQVILAVHKGKHMAEAKLHVPHHEIFAEQESDDMYSTVDLLVEKLNRQLMKQKEKVQNHTGIDKRAVRPSEEG